MDQQKKAATQEAMLLGAGLAGVPPGLMQPPPGYMYKMVDPRLVEGQHQQTVLEEYYHLPTGDTHENSQEIIRGN